MGCATAEKIDDNHIDDHVETEIQACFDIHAPKCFFTYAGAGSGKTRSLVNTLNFIKENFGVGLNMHSKQVAVITYTNAACDEILSRVEYSSIFFVSTIHSFLWELIRPYQHDIKKWVKDNIQKKLEETEAAEAKGRKGTKTSNERLKKIEGYKRRLEKLDSVRKFSYNPIGENVGYASLDHADIIKMGSEFIKNKDTMQNILVSRFPILLIDESQDTKKELVDALLTVNKNHNSDIIIGMFGDTMQKVYLDGKDNLAACIPEDWVKPTKVMNHRSTKRIVQLANSIRSCVDDKIQQPRSNSMEGVVHLFIADSLSDKAKVEFLTAKRMAKLTSDSKWENAENYKSLILEHHMAAKRLGFFNLFSPLYANKKLSQSVLEGSLPEARLFSQMIFPIIEANKQGNRFEISKIVKQYSPLLSKENFQKAGVNQLSCIQTANQAVLSLCEIFQKKTLPSCIEVLKEVSQTGLLELPDRTSKLLADYIAGEDVLLDSLQQALSISVCEMESYCSYVDGATSFATHQGVKGLEYPRVMVVMDDAEAEGFLFSYEKLFGAQEMSDTDLKNEREGKDNSISRTRRLFYVACTRAKQSLALVAYTKDRDTVKKTMIDNRWFNEDEIEFV